MSSLDFNTTLLDISNELLGDQLGKMKFLCKECIGKNVSEKIDTGFKLFQVLMERNKLAADDTDFLSSLLTRVGRDDLARKLGDCEPGLSLDEEDKAERAKLSSASDVIAQNIGRNWRRLGRKLGLTQVKLESISQKFPTDLEETAQELLQEWRKAQGGKARTEELLKALRDCHQNLTADKVEHELA